MSFKAKDLQFDNAQPAFLRRLRGELSGDSSSRHEQPIPRNKRMKQDEDDDAPTYVLEDTNQSLTKDEFESLVAGKEAKEQEKSVVESGETQGDEERTPKDRIAEVGASKKRKIAKVISVDQEPPADETESKDAQTSKVKEVKKQKKQKKGKAIKLAFGGEEET